MIKFVVLDFDGVFTSGRVFINNEGTILKHYNAKDGHGMKLLRDKGLEIGVISGYEKNDSQLNIIKHLNIKYFSLGTNEKLNVLKKWCDELNLNMETEVAYMGDDINDIELMNNVKLKGCPIDSHEKCLKIADFISKKKGGDGCVREFIEYIIEIIERSNMKISCVIPCAKINDVENQNLRKFYNSSLLNIKLDTIKNNNNFDEIVLSSNDLELEKENLFDNKIKYKNRENFLCKSDILQYNELYKEYFNIIENKVLVQTTPSSPFLLNTTINKIIDYWIYNPKCEMIVASRNIRTLTNNLDIELQQAFVMLDKDTLKKYNNNITEIKNIKYFEIDELEGFIVNNNLNFLIAETLFQRSLNNKELINNYMLNNSYQNAKILDCTIRDTGYCNNWNWSYEFVKTLAFYMNEIGIEYCEIGFLLDEKYAEKGAGIWRTINKDLSIIKRLKNDIYVNNKTTKIAVMFDIGDNDRLNYNIDDLPPQEETSIDLIRVCCYYQILEKTKDIIMKLKEKGYELTLNIMYASHINNYEILQKIKLFVKDLPIKYLYFADSIGGLIGDEINSFFLNLKEIYPIENGFHNHDNNGTVFTNINNLLNNNINIFDTTISGFGKNGGNCPFELIILNLCLKKNYKKYNINKILEFIDEIKDYNFYDNNKIDINKIKDMIQQFLNIHSSHTKKFYNDNLLDYYNNIVGIEYKSKW